MAESIAVNTRQARRDWRWPVTLLLAACIVLLGYGFSRLPGNGVQAVATDVPAVDARADHPKLGFEDLPASSSVTLREQAEAMPANPASAAKKAASEDARQILQQAEAEMKAKNYTRAIAMLNAAQPLLKDIPETYLMLGRALEARQDFRTARDFYRAAIDRDPYFADAYWGFATASEGMGDLQSALGGMRSYLHTERNPDPRRLRVAQARSAIWEWESQLGRGPWGPSKGIPPGFTADDLKRDGRGVGIKMPIPGTRQPDGTMQSEVKSQDKFKLFKED